ncbi:hypothetical protein NECID01_1348 [Nematocida sp. AWRm77]|nr:hypothetical protein NECID01_1348 [Nematocida sp. AWRm77]
MSPQPAVRIGGRGAPRRTVQKKAETGNNLDKVKSVLGSSGYTVKPVAGVENCSFIGKDNTVINYPTPTVQAVFHKDNQPIGYILQGRGEILNGGNKPTFDLETIVAALGERGIDIKDLVKKVEENGDKQAMEEICRILKETDFSDPQEDAHAEKECCPGHSEDGAKHDKACAEEKQAE